MAALAAFQEYKQFYTEQVVPRVTEQKEVEAAMMEVEPKAALDAEVTSSHCTCCFSADQITLCQFCSHVLYRAKRQHTYCLYCPPKRIASPSGLNLAIKCAAYQATSAKRQHI